MSENLRRCWAIVRTTALEISSEPLSLLLTMGAAATVALTSALHFHQFGEPSRMARDAGLSALLVFGILSAVFCTLRVFRREIESGTMQIGLAHPISRRVFFLSKVTGAVFANLIFCATLASVTVTTVIGAEVGGLIALAKGDVANIWGLSLAFDVGVLLLPLVLAAALNRFAHWRFTTTAVVLMLILSLIAVVANQILASLFCGPRFPNVESELLNTAVRLVPALVMAVLPSFLFVSVGAAFSVRFADHAVAALSGLVFLSAIPALSNYYLSDALAKGGTVPWTYVICAVLALVPLALGFIALGLFLFNDRDVG